MALCWSTAEESTGPTRRFIKVRSNSRCDPIDDAWTRGAEARVVLLGSTEDMAGEAVARSISLCPLGGAEEPGMTRRAN